MTVVVYGWRQPICNACYAERNPELPDPPRLVEPDAETCAYCGLETYSGVYVRDNPEAVPYPQIKEWS